MVLEVNAVYLIRLFGLPVLVFYQSQKLDILLWKPRDRLVPPMYYLT
jgi:hypothetical protein